MLRTTSTLSVLLLSATMSFAADKNGSLNSHDADFLKDAASGAMAEVELGKVAEAHGSTDAVKQYGQRMVTDHNAQLAELKTLAQSKGVDLPTEPTKHEKDKAEKLAKKSGEDFDKAYAKDMVSDHKTDVKDFQKAADKSTDPDVKAFAEKQLPTLKQHLSEAEKLPGA